MHNGVCASNQGVLEAAVHKLFHHERILTNVRKELSELHNPETGSPMEVDLWIPERNICFEFQDDYHYGTAWYAHKTTERVRHDDTIKSETLRKQGVNLIDVPFWWDGTDESLSSSVLFSRPDIMLETVTAHPIPLNPSLEILSRSRIPDVGELMVASFPPDIITFANSVSVDNKWWMGEKYDGVRVCWHPNLRKPYTRSGLILELPDKAGSLCGGIFLDSEIWFGRGSFLETQKLVHTSSEAINWSLFRFIAFDVPDPSFREKTFEFRFKHLISHSVPDHPFIVPTARLLCEDSMQLKSAAKSVINAGGEGVILRKPRSAYVSGRSNFLFKFKAAIEDAEALVVQIKDDSCQLLLPNGVSFTISARQTQHVALARGDVVTFNYIRQGTNPISPANVQIFRKRKDLTWEELLKKGGACPLISDTNMESSSSRRLAKRLVLESFAKSHNFDPLVPANWYSISRKLILQEHPGLLVEYNGSLARTLLDVFPEIGLDKSSFKFLQITHWNDVENRRRFFLDFARKFGFDPLVAKNWYSYYPQIRQSKRARAVAALYGGSHARALVNLFPEVSLQISKFGTTSKPPEEYWRSVENRVSFFRNFAAYHYFDPLVPENWYRVSKHDILTSLKCAKAVLQWHPGHVSQALTTLFPDIGLELRGFAKVRGNWHYERNRKEFFKKFAATKGFDPLVADNWFLVSRNDINSFEHGDVVLRFYDGNFVAALSQLFPDLAIQDLSEALPEKHFTSKENRRAFFDRFAKSKYIEPLSPLGWYQITNYDICAYEYGRKILAYYKMDHRTALLSLYPDIGLEFSKFSSYSDKYWRHSENATNFLRNFAAIRGFDAESARHQWYSIGHTEIVATRYGKAVVWHHGGNHITALKKLFPNLELKLYKFLHIPDKFWDSPQNRRELFEEFAENCGHPGMALNWRKLPEKSFAAFPHGTKILRYYSGSYLRAIASLYPEHFRVPGT